jgi:hypothetical protein
MKSLKLGETPMIKLLLEAGFDTGWALSDEVLVLWENDQEPPSPLVRPELIELVEE